MFFVRNYRIKYYREKLIFQDHPNLFIKKKIIKDRNWVLRATTKKVIIKWKNFQTTDLNQYNRNRQDNLSCTLITCNKLINCSRLFSHFQPAIPSPSGSWPSQRRQDAPGAGGGRYAVHAPAAVHGAGPDRPRDAGEQARPHQLGIGVGGTATVPSEHSSIRSDNKQ